MFPKSLSQYEPITGEKGSFAHFTIEKRLPVILDRLMAENHYDGEIIQRLQSIRANILHGKIEYLPKLGQDVSRWESYITPYLGRSWFEVPFYFAEAYFYRLILDAVSYFQNLTDPFFLQKKTFIEQNLEVMEQVIADLAEAAFEDKIALTQRLLKLSLWGNKSDLSQLKLDRKLHDEENTLIDDSGTITNFFAKRLQRMDIILDNSGMELFTDLLLAQWLVSNGWTERITLHAKFYPTFVSDATANDIDILLDYLQKSDQSSTIEFARTFSKHIHEGRIAVRSHEFWNSPLHFYQMPNDLLNDLQTSDLIIFKGDANYRRIFGDRQIPQDRPTADLVDYLPTKSVAIRILKSEIMTGIDKERARILHRENPDWQVSGKFGIIQSLNF